MTDPSDTSAVIQRISASSDLFDIRTIATFSRLHDNPPSTGAALSADVSVHLDGDVAEERFQIVGKFGVKARETGAPERPYFFAASIHLVAHYRLREGKLISESELEPFARTAGMLHLWPYFRSFVQQSCGQLSISPIVLPPFRANGSMNVRFRGPHGSAGAEEFS